MLGHTVDIRLFIRHLDHETRGEHRFHVLWEVGRRESDAHRREVDCKEHPDYHGGYSTHLQYTH